MADKYYGYIGFLGWIHGVRDNLREKWLGWRELSFSEWVSTLTLTDNNETQEDYSHIYREKTRGELVRISAAVMGIEFSYAAETAFVSPTLLKIGVEHKHMTLVWALSPLIGFFLTPILGSLSDRCPLKLGRRRPFIFMMSLGVLLGLILVPNGEDLGYALGDKKSIIYNHTHSNSVTTDVDNFTSNDNFPERPENSHPWGVFFTVLGTVLLDFDADACQSPSRAYLLDVTIPDDHAKGLSTFTIMAGLGGFLGYALGGIDWDATFIGVLFGGHVRAVFSLITIIFIICVAYTLTSFKEMPLRLLELQSQPNGNVNYENMSNQEHQQIDIDTKMQYGTLTSIQEKVEGDSNGCSTARKLEPTDGEDILRKRSIAPPPDASLLIYLKSIVYMPYSIKLVCLTNLFCWMAHVCYSLYFTDFVGEAVFGGNPTAQNDESRELYESGIRFGCWGMSMYSLSCACYSLIIEKLIQRFGAKKVYVGGLLMYSSGMFLMAVTKHKVGVILFSWTAGVMYSTLFTMPYLLIANYHARGVFELTDTGEPKISTQIRGLGTDVAIVSSMVFLAQFILSICMGTIVDVSGTTTAVVSVASFLAFLGALTATRVMYLDL